MLAWLQNLKLSLYQWIVLTFAGIIGILVFITRLQGSKIHKLQVDLLVGQFNDVMAGQNKAVSAAHDRMQTAYKAYKAAGGQM